MFEQFPGGGNNEGFHQTKHKEDPIRQTASGTMEQRRLDSKRNSLEDN